MTALDLAKEWLRYAKSDLNTANHMFYDANPKETEISCYHTQQCAEKSLKAYLISKGIDPPYILDLVELNQLCTAQESSFSGMLQYCVFLNPYGVHVRYPNELAVDDTLTKLAIENALKIFDFCEKLISTTTSTANTEDEK
jgi:HEPN domain-containing protein